MLILSGKVMARVLPSRTAKIIAFDLVCLYYVGFAGLKEVHFCRVSIKTR
jgi:hypothetical protein